MEITEFNDLPQGGREGRPHYTPQGLAVGSDGAIWVAESNTASDASPIVARVIASGKRTAKYRYGEGPRRFWESPPAPMDGGALESRPIGRYVAGWGQGGTAAAVRTGKEPKSERAPE